MGCVTIDQMTGNLKCIVASILAASFYWFAPPKNKWILVIVLYVMYLMIAWYDYSYECKRNELGPSPLMHFYDWAKPRNTSQHQQYQNLCKDTYNIILVIDIVVLSVIVALIPMFLRWNPSVEGYPQYLHYHESSRLHPIRYQDTPEFAYTKIKNM
ncbi:hypothetical protein EhV003 [Emiliania huxleyi virus 86]|uniref:Putative membrane protein n=2 Tax=Emiliania huxleyi virus 86 TaxID=181082 RepID=Q4A3B8_EHV8U|nr:hypothetical protein EhV003 [Emiliania huxleyi virus 86]AEO97814.1 hypothetical protein ENVG_00116 [Emiliania huxleyi virus 84]AEO98222.1 hypothetical protein ELVG_00173 [Emiliania huxleyi virus 203]AEP14939.1 hypothetical protein EOVG_00002 [Emiliania huxleyi virus 88]AEP15869.1 hypothetical protein EQVG_00461 [Emiliania huxleyi virus 207]AEP16258.1 hypothetical protein ERVG_00385 [Emiliania huxleyi virus 208]AET97891.1 hypothetical protein EPVG_00003 [Emiliania huxleyi virus 201]AHA5455